MGIVPFSITTILASYFGGTGMMRVNLLCSLIGFIICLLLDILLIPMYGNTGAALATIVSYFLSTSFIVYVYIKNTGSRLTDMILLKKEDLLLIRHKFLPTSSGKA